jgi:hypothetical protein
MTFSVLVTLICVLLLYYINANQTNPVIKTDSLYSHPSRDVGQAVSIRLKRRTKLSDFDGFGTPSPPPTASEKA